MTASIGADTITVLRAELTVTERYGSKRHRDWSTATSTTVSGVSVQPFTAVEQTADREHAATRLRLFAPPTLDLAATDRVVWRGTTFEVDGEPARWFDTDTGAAEHVEAVLKRMSG
ncbi:MAG TPA: hypothetical protein VK453_24340 [Micromonosporaceae bacterium]|nr:hypothetical protein [Micromonosporaceae bacterium]